MKLFRDFFSTIIFSRPQIVNVFRLSVNINRANFSTAETIANETFYVLLAVHLSIILDNDQLDTHLLHFTIDLL